MADHKKYAEALNKYRRSVTKDIGRNIINDVYNCTVRKMFVMFRVCDSIELKLAQRVRNDKR